MRSIMRSIHSVDIAFVLLLLIVISRTACGCGKGRASVNEIADVPSPATAPSTAHDEDQQHGARPPTQRAADVNYNFLLALLGFDLMHLPGENEQKTETRTAVGSDVMTTRDALETTDSLTAAVAGITGSLTETTGSSQTVSEAADAAHDDDEMHGGFMDASISHTAVSTTAINNTKNIREPTTLHGGRSRHEATSSFGRVERSSTADVTPHLPRDRMDEWVTAVNVERLSRTKRRSVPRDAVPLQERSFCVRERAPDAVNLPIQLQPIDRRPLNEAAIWRQNNNTDVEMNRLLEFYNLNQSMATLPVRNISLDGDCSFKSNDSRVSANVRQFVCTMARVEFALGAISQLEGAIQLLTRSAVSGAIASNLQSIQYQFCLGFQHFQVFNERPKFIANQQTLSLIDQVRRDGRYFVKREFNVGCAIFVRSLLKQYSS